MQLQVGTFDSAKHRWRFFRLLSCASAIATLLLIALSQSAPLAAQTGSCGSGTTIIICIDPITQTIGQNTVTTADIRIDNIPVIAGDQSLYGADVQLTYSQFIVCAQDGGHPCPNSTSVTLTPGPLLTQTDSACSSSCSFVLTNFANNSNGTIRFVITRLNPALSVSGSGVLATLTFYGLAGPFTPIHFTTTKLSSRNATQIAAPTQDGEIDVTAPTAVTLSSLHATLANSAQDAIALDWQTESQINTAGFNLYRSSQAQGPYRLINNSLIPVSGDSLGGAKYHFEDTTVTSSETYYYQVEELGLDGRRSRHPPVAITVPVSSDRNSSIIPLLASGTFLIIASGAFLGWRKRRRL